MEQDRKVIRDSIKKFMKISNASPVSKENKTERQKVMTFRDLSVLAETNISSHGYTFLRERKPQQWYQLKSDEIFAKISKQFNKFNKTILLPMPYKVVFISLPNSAKRQRETK